jgi:hypothetical protein
MMYGRTTEVIELVRPDFETDLKGMDGFEKVKDHDANVTASKA